MMCIALELHIGQSDVRQLILIEGACRSHHAKFRVLERLLIRTFDEKVATTAVGAMHLVRRPKGTLLVSCTHELIVLETCIPSQLL